MTTNGRRILETISLAALLCVLLGGCNTIEGAGEDIEQAGDEIEDVTQ